MSNSSENTLLDILRQYKTEFDKDSSINEMNIRDRQMMLPGIKHKYVAYLIQHKHKKFELECAERKAIHDMMTAATPDIGLSRPAMEKKHEGHPAIKRINEMIEEQEILITYLEKVETITRSMTYDLSNLIKIIELETT